MVIEAVGLAKDVTVPYDAETIDGKGLVVYPGFIDLYSTAGQRAGVDRSATGKGRPVDLAEAPLPSTPPDNRSGLTPEFEVAGALELHRRAGRAQAATGLHRLAVGPARCDRDRPECAGQPERPAPARGRSCAAPVALHVNLAPPTEPATAAADRSAPTARADARPRSVPAPGPRRRRARREPVSARADGLDRPLPPGDARQRPSAEARCLLRVARRRPARRSIPALKALQAARAKKLPVWWEANTRDEIHRALDLAEEFGTTAVIVGGREAGKVADRLKASKVPVVLRLDFPAEPKVPTEEEYQKKPRAERDEPLRVLAHRKPMEETGRHRGRAGQGRGSVRVSARGHRAASTRSRRACASSSRAGLTADDALAGSDAERRGHRRRRPPARHARAGQARSPDRHDGSVLRREGQGSLRPGRRPEVRDQARGSRAHQGPLRQSDGRPDGEAVDRPAGGTRTAPGGPATARGDATKRVARAGEVKRRTRPNTKKPPSRTKDAATARSSPSTPTTRSRARPTESTEASQTTATSATATTRSPSVRREAGGIRRAQGRQTAGRRSGPTKTDEAGESKAASQKAEPAKPAAAPFVDVAVELDDDRKPTLHTGGDVLIKDATILTVTHGTIAKGSILVKDGKIEAVGADVTAPQGVKVIEAAGHGRDAGHHRHPLAHRRPGGRQRGQPLDRPRGPGQGRRHRRRRRRSTGPWPAERRRRGCSTARPTRSAARTP